MDFEAVMVSKLVRQRKTNTIAFRYYVEDKQTNKHIQNEKRLMITRREGVGGRPKGVKGHLCMLMNKN